MNKKNAIFIHSLFRTGSTYIWNTFRQSGVHHCYYEPFHQELAFLETANLDRWSSGPDIAETMGHPLLDREYMHEYRHLLRPGEKGVPFFKKSFSFDDFCNNDSNPGQKKYLDFLLENAGGRIPVLQFNRSALRLGWFKKYYPDVFHVYLLRDPRQQFHSFLAQQEKKNLDIFLLMNLLTAGVNMRKGTVFRDLARRLPLFEYHAADFGLEERFYRILLPFYSLAEQYFIHGCIWFAALLENLAHADMFLNMDLLSGDGGYRAEVSRRLADASGKTLDFSDARITKTGMRFLPDAEAGRIEADVQTMILKRIGREQLKKLSERLASEGPAADHFSQALWPELQSRDLPAVDIKRALITRQKAIYEALSPQVMELKKEVKALLTHSPMKELRNGREVSTSTGNRDALKIKLQLMTALLEIPAGKSRGSRRLLRDAWSFLRKGGHGRA